MPLLILHPRSTRHLLKLTKVSRPLSPSLLCAIQTPCAVAEAFFGVCVCVVKQVPAGRTVSAKAATESKAFKQPPAAESDDPLAFLWDDLPPITTKAAEKEAAKKALEAPALLRAETACDSLAAATARLRLTAKSGTEQERARFLENSDIIVRAQQLIQSGPVVLGEEKSEKKVEVSILSSMLTASGSTAPVDVTCKFCLGIFVAPVRLTCGHAFCKSCAKLLIALYKMVAPRPFEQVKLAGCYEDVLEAVVDGSECALASIATRIFIGVNPSPVSLCCPVCHDQTLASVDADSLPKADDLQAALLLHVGGRTGESRGPSALGAFP